VRIFLAIELYPCISTGHGFDPRDVSTRVRFVVVSQPRGLSKNGLNNGKHGAYGAIT
jgi:hypothetical protein